MSLASSIEQKISQLLPGEVFSSSQLKLTSTTGARQAISRLEKKGIIQRLDGIQSLYYIPKKGILGNIKPTRGQIVEAIINRQKKGYRTGLSLYNMMGLTTQVPGSVTIATEATPQSTTVAGLDVKFVKAKGPITKKSIPLLQILDVINDIKDIPDTTPDMVFTKIIKTIKNLEEKPMKLLTTLALKYPKRVQALVGATFEFIKEDELATKLRKNLNLGSAYNIGISEALLPNKSNWNIL